ncbi:protein of unknown function [Micromonospora pallida]|uniref:DUF397 domain-containing protein n=1 Tax=Micromonospora pallida TaxID=145854 RepID=A0A1C6TKL1_9ACTN|nr:DUF397 domain-containing protein [Micromonospora pallida]SCL42167.1 protein of unknown function [Micromonospora pallida]SCL43365.1 protein of unknown function [Micromonospora pallida]
MRQMKWTRPTRCDNSGPNCPEVAIGDDGTRYVRDSERPDEVVTFSPAGWDALVGSIRDGQQL